MPSIHDGHVNSSFAGQFGRSKLGDHSAAAERALTVALSLQRRGQLPNDALQPWFLASIGNKESVDIRSRSSQSAFTAVASRELSSSLSPKAPSSSRTETLSFSLTIGTTPSESNCAKAFWRLR